jgi:hypothetical protein
MEKIPIRKSGLKGVLPMGDFTLPCAKNIARLPGDPVDDYQTMEIAHDLLR